MANTVIQLKYSESTATPTSLNVAEPAYSNNSNKLFIGLAGNQVIAIGGKYYTDLVDAATDANTVSTIVKRDASGIFSATAVRASLFGNANTAAAWQTARTIGVSGDANGTVSVDGSANANIPLTLGSTGVSAGTYGGATQIPTFVVDSKGRLTSAANVAISTSFGIAGDTGTGTVAGGETLTIVGRDGITTVAVDANNSVLVDVDNTVFRTTGGTISGDLAVTGNLVISGNTITQDVETIVVQDSLIELAANNAADALDIGLFGQYNDGSTKYTALFRDASDSGKYKLLTGGTTKPSAGNTVDPTTFSTGTLVTNIEATTVTIKGINVLDKANGAYDTANSAFIRANNSLNVSSGGSVTGSIGVTGNVYAGNVIANSAFTSLGGTTKLQLTDIGLVSVHAGGQEFKFGASGIESTPGIFGGAFGGNKLSLNNETILVSDRFDLVKIQTGENGTVKNEFSFANNAFIAPGEIEAGSVVAGGINVVPTLASSFNHANGAFDKANTDVTVINITAADYGNTSFVPAFRVEANGRISSANSTAIAIAASAITSGTLGVTRGGTGFASYTANGVIIGGTTSTSALTSVASSTEGHVLQISSTGVPTFAHLNGGSF